MKTFEENSDWKAVSQGGTVKIAAQKTFGLFHGLPRGTAEQINEACDRFFESRNIVYGNSWFHERKRNKDNRTKER